MSKSFGCIDVHAHLVPDFYRDAVIESGRGPTLSTGFPLWSVERQLDTMDRVGIATSINSISQPGVHFGDDAKARALARRCNETMAKTVADHPTRFGGFGVLPLPDVEGACAEIDYALDRLKLDGIGILASYGEDFICDPKFEPVLATLDRHAATVFIHPNFHPRSRGIQKELAGFVLEFTFDTTRAVAGLLFSGALDRYPNINFILAHAGGALPYLSWRLSVAPLVDSSRYGNISRERIIGQLARCYFDTAQASGPQVLSCITEITSPDQIIFGSDWPYCSEEVAEITIRSIAENKDAGKFEGIYRRNCLKLFPRLA